MKSVLADIDNCPIGGDNGGYAQAKDFRQFCK